MSRLPSTIPLTIGLATLALASGARLAESRIADVLVYYEPGVDAVGGFTSPAAALVRATAADDANGIVSLGGWSDDPESGSGLPTGIVIGWSTPVRNGPGYDLRVVGNNFGAFPEPGFIEVAPESSGGGATVDGWEDEMFYLIRPPNFDLLSADPRSAPAAISVFPGAPVPLGGHEWHAPLHGYADVSPAGDLFSIEDAIDETGQPVVLDSIAYVRVRTVGDASAAPFGTLSTELDYIEALHGPPAPQSLTVVTGAAFRIAPIYTSAAGTVIEALGVRSDDTVFFIESDYARGADPTVLLSADASGGPAAALETEPRFSYGAPKFGSFVSVTDSQVVFGESSDGTIRSFAPGNSSPPSLVTTVTQNFDLTARGDRVYLSHNPNVFPGQPANRISRLNLADGSLDTVVQTAEFSGAVTLSPSGDLWYASPTFGRGLYRFSPTQLASVEDPSPGQLDLNAQTPAVDQTFNRVISCSDHTLVAHDFSTLFKIDPRPLDAGGSAATTPVATTAETAGTMAAANDVIYVVVTDFDADQSSIYLLWSLTTFEQWQGVHFSPEELGDPGSEGELWGDLADPDRDGIPNLIEYAQGGLPRSPSPRSSPEIGLEDGERRFSFVRGINRPDLTSVVERSDDLTNWTPIARAPEGGATAPLIPGVQIREERNGTSVRVTVADAEATSARYYRLRVERSGS